MEKYFFLDESPYYKGKYVIRINLEEMPFKNGTRGSYTLLIPRILNLSYTDYLRYARDRLGADLVGKNARYVVAYFDNNKEARALVRLLNSRMEYIMNERANPYDYKVNEDGTIERTPIAQNESNE